jgi:hypothetical protein
VAATDLEPCPQCGAPGGEGACLNRFEALLALDHSRREPWGPRHGLAVAVYTLQHPAGASRGRLERSWLVAYRCAVSGDDPWRLAKALSRRARAPASDWGVPPLPPTPDSGGYGVTIQDLGDFQGSSYPDALTSWARATIDRWGGEEADSGHSKPVEHPVQTQKRQ